MKLFSENNESFEKLFTDNSFYEKVMDAMAKELYKKLRK
jgi:type I restriction enzyme R subunit